LAEVERELGAEGLVGILGVAGVLGVLYCFVVGSGTCAR
jgi:hypothetical protein